MQYESAPGVLVRPAPLVLVLVLLLSLTILPASAQSQGGVKEFTGDYDADLFAVTHAEDGGYVLVGLAGHDPDWSGVALKINETGAVEWRTRLNRSGGYNVPNDIVRVDDGYVVVGTGGPPNRYVSGSAWATSLSEEGEIVWSEDFGGGRFYAATRSVDGDGVFAVGEGSVGGVWISPDGEKIAERGYARVVTGVIADDGGYVLSGSDVVEPVLDGWAAKIKPSGDLVWESYFVREGFNRFEDVGRSGTGGYAFGGRTDTDDTSELPAWLVNTDADGNTTSESLLADPLIDGWVYTVSEGPNRTTLSGGKSIPGSGWVTKTRAGETVDKMEFGAPVRDILLLGNGRGLVVMEDGGVTVTEFVPPEATVTVEPESGEISQTTFTISAEDSTDNVGIQEYSWDFGSDGEVDRTTEEPTTEKIYRNLGVVNTEVIVVDDDGNTAAASVPVEITDTTPPDIGLSAPEPLKIHPSAPAVFDASATTDNHVVQEYRWDFDGDGTPEETTTEPRTRHRFDEERERQVSLTVVDESGNTEERKFDVEVVTDNPAPELSVTSPEFFVRGEKETLSAETTDEVGTPTVTWRLPDGRTIENESVRVGFDTEGGKTIEVVAEDEYGEKTTEELEVNVRERYPSDTSSTSGPPAVVRVIRALVRILLRV